MTKPVTACLLCFFVAFQGPWLLHSKEANGLVVDSGCTEKQGYDSIKQLHIHMDDDRSGDLDRAESNGFIRDELKYDDGFERQEHFHGNDEHITVEDLWHLWKQSEVFNYTNADVLDWLENYVGLPQYSELFKRLNITGAVLPRIASNSSFLSASIKSPIDRQKLTLKAMDAVLFGVPRGHSYIKDIVLTAALGLAAVFCWMAYRQNKYAQKHLKRVMKDMEHLQKSEEALLQLQSKLEQACKEKNWVTEEKRSLEEKYKEEIDAAKNEAKLLQTTRESTAEEISRLKLAEQELEKLKRALDKAECQLQERQQSMLLPELQQWLQLTFERENSLYIDRKNKAEEKLQEAKELCEKIHKKTRTGFLGSLRVTHSKAVDDADKLISVAKEALGTVRDELQERSHRWRQIERICGFDIIENPGLDALKRTLHASNSFAVAQAAAMSQTNNDHHRVWPNLMKAGMQLTMLGLNLTDRKLGAMHQFPLTFTDMPRPHTMQNLSTLGSTYSLASSTAIAPTPTTAAPACSRRTAWVRNESFKQSTESKASDVSVLSTMSSVGSDAGGVEGDKESNNEDCGTSVEFNLGESNSSHSVRKCPSQDTIIVSPHANAVNGVAPGKTLTVASGNPRKSSSTGPILTRPESVATTQSPGGDPKDKGSVKAPTVPPPATQPDDCSSNSEKGSQEQLNTSTDKSQEGKGKKKLFKKFFKSSKQKES